MTTANNIKQIFKNGLRERVAVYVPSTIDAVNDGSDISARMVERVAAALSEMFGGATITEGRGAWMSAEHGLIIEQVTIIYSYCNNDALEQNAARLHELAEQIRDEMRQEAVSVEINDELYFV